MKELALTGALKRNPKRFASRLNPPKPAKGLGAPPKHFKAAERAMWEEIAGMLLPGVAGNCDRHAMELLTVLMLTFRKHGVGGKLGITNRDMSIMLQLWNQIGFTPAARARLNIPKQDEFADLTAEERLDRYLSMGERPSARRARLAQKNEEDDDGETVN